MELIELPPVSTASTSASTSSTPSSSPSSTASSSSSSSSSTSVTKKLQMIAALSSEVLNRGMFYVSNAQVAVVLPPRTTPNKLDKHMCRLFSAADGKWLCDINTEYYSLGTAMCYDRCNNIFWNMNCSSNTLLYWRNSCTLRHLDSISFNTAFHSKTSPPPSPSSISVSVSESDEKMTAVESVLEVVQRLDKLAQSVYPVAAEDEMNMMLDVLCHRPFAVDVTKRLFEEIDMILEITSSEYFKQSGLEYSKNSAAAQLQHFYQYLIAASLRILKTNFAILLHQHSSHLREQVLQGIEFSLKFLRTDE
jgi:hypothetical protein